jgi:hypothetical protein
MTFLYPAIRYKLYSKNETKVNMIAFNRNKGSLTKTPQLIKVSNNEPIYLIGFAPKKGEANYDNWKSIPHSWRHFGSGNTDSYVMYQPNTRV